MKIDYTGIKFSFQNAASIDKEVLQHYSDLEHNEKSKLYEHNQI